MELTPNTDINKPWTVQIIGRWNPVILSPIGIGRRLFKITDDLPAAGLVALFDASSVNGPKVRYGDLEIGVEFDRLTVAATSSNNRWSQLGSALNVAKLALDDLPKTPIFGLGMNLFFREDGKSEPLRRLYPNEWRSRLFSASLDFRHFLLGHRIGYRGGDIYLNMYLPENGDFDIHFLIHLQSSDLAQLQDWAATPVADIQSKVEEIMGTVAK